MARRDGQSGESADHVTRERDAVVERSVALLALHDAKQRDRAIARLSGAVRAATAATVAARGPGPSAPRPPARRP
jgi:hypothetical protein